jgi:hypothetical protein
MIGPASTGGAGSEIIAVMTMQASTAASVPLATAADLVDLARYPIADLASAVAQRVILDYRRQLAATGVALLHGFLTPAATAAMAAEARAHAGRAFFCDSTHNVYLEPDDGAFPFDHPRRRRLHTVVGSIAYDLLPHDSPLRRLYNWDNLLGFVRQVLGRPALYRLADPLGALSINVFKPGGHHSWHFDETEYTTTIMLQEAEQGGHFEYLPHLRRADAGEYDTVRRILDGDEQDVQRLPFTAGSLSIFAGRVSMHRVTEILGGRLRLVAVLAFNGKPGVTNSDEVRRLFWGRTH